MEFPFDARAVIVAAADGHSSAPNSRGAQLTVLSTQSLARLSSANVDRASIILDTMGKRSAAAQGLPAVITTFQKVLGTPAQRVYISHNRKSVLGFLKTGKKHLFIRTLQGNWKELDIMCVLDFYVHEKCQRQGMGKFLFDNMLRQERLGAHQLGYDRPSPKLLPFLAKHHGLRNFVPQNNNYIVFDDYFKDPAVAGNSNEQQRSSEDRSQMMPVSARPLSGSRPRRCRKRHSPQQRQSQGTHTPDRVESSHAQSFGSVTHHRRHHDSSAPQRHKSYSGDASLNSGVDHRHSSARKSPLSTFPLRSVSPIRRPSSESILSLLSDTRTPVKHKRSGSGRCQRAVAATSSSASIGASSSPRYSVLGTPLLSRRHHHGTQTHTSERISSRGAGHSARASIGGGVAASLSFYGSSRRDVESKPVRISATRPPFHPSGQHIQHQKIRGARADAQEIVAPMAARRMESAPATYERHKDISCERQRSTAVAVTARRPLGKKQAFSAASSMLLSSALPLCDSQLITPASSDPPLRMTRRRGASSRGSHNTLW